MDRQGDMQPDSARRTAGRPTDGRIFTSDVYVWYVHFLYFVFFSVFEFFNRESLNSSKCPMERIKFQKRPQFYVDFTLVVYGNAVCGNFI